MFTNRITRICALLFPEKKKTLSIFDFHNIYRYCRRPHGNKLTGVPQGLCIVSPYIYKNIHIKPAILDIKRGVWSNRACTLVETLADELISLRSDRTLRQYALSGTNTLLVHVPSSAYAQRKKNFDHMEQCLVRLESLCKGFFVPVIGAVQIHKDKLVKSQHKLNKRERSLHAKGKFYIQSTFITYIRTNYLESSHIYCIDDITTTGSTLSSIADTISNQFPAIEITGITIAS